MELQKVLVWEFLKLEVFIKDTGKTISAMEKEFSLGKTTSNTKENLLPIKEKVMVYTNGKTAKFIKAIGKMINETAKVNYIQKAIIVHWYILNRNKLLKNHLEEKDVSSSEKDESKGMQSKLLKQWLEQEGEEVVLSREPGGTDLGQGLRKILLGHETGAISPRAEALLYAADRAHHVFSTIRPALDRGEVVISDRYFDSSAAYQGAGRVLIPGEVARISRWATESLYPTLTILIDLPAEVGLARLQSLDRLEAEPKDFHERVRQEFLQIAMMDPERYFVVDGTQSVEDIHKQIIEPGIVYKPYSFTKYNGIIEFACVAPTILGFGTIIVVKLLNAVLIPLSQMVLNRL